jgi:hypothetical protein
MPQYSTPITTYSQQADTKPRIVGDRIWTNGTQDVMLLKLIGRNSARGKFMFNSEDGCKIEWLETGLTPNVSKATAAVTAATTTGNDVNGNPVYAAMTIPITNPEYYNRGMILYQAPPSGYTVLATDKADGYQYFWVQSVNTTAKTLTVLPGFLGTKNHAIAVNDDICILTTAEVECAEYQDTFNQQIGIQKNYVQMFTDYISLSEKVRLIDHYGINDLFDFEMNRIMGGMVGSTEVSGDLPKKLEHALWYGLPNVGSESYPATMGGINSFGIKSYTEAAVSRDLIERVAYDLYREGSDAKDIVLGGNLLQEVSNWYDPYVRTSSLSTVGGAVKTIDTAYGSFNIHNHRGLRPNEIYFLDFARIGVYMLEDFKTKPLATNGFCDRWGISGYFSLALANPCKHARIRLTSACNTGKEPFTCSAINLTPTLPKSPGVVA